MGYSYSLYGKWNYTGYFMRIGGPGNWYTVSPVNPCMELQENGLVKSNLLPFKDADHLRMTDASTFKFIIPSAPDGFFSYHFIRDAAPFKPCLHRTLCC